jgi:hypothetical protein
MKRRGLGGGAKTVAIAGAALSGAFGASLADAVPIYEDPVDVEIMPGLGGAVTLNLSQLVNPNSRGPDAVINYNFDTPNNTLNLNFHSLNNLAAAIQSPLTRDAEIGPNSDFHENFNLGFQMRIEPPKGEWVGATNAFLGLRVDVPGASPHYGWARLTVDERLGLVLHDLAIEKESNTPITAGAGIPVPEPGSLGLLALGAVGLAAWRKRRAQG